MLSTGADDRPGAASPLRDEARCGEVAFAARNRAREPVNWRAAVAAPRRSQACAAGLASPLPALGLRHGTRARDESTPALHSKTTQQPFTVCASSDIRELSVWRGSIVG